MGTRLPGEERRILAPGRKTNGAAFAHFVF